MCCCPRSVCLSLPGVTYINANTTVRPTQDIVVSLASLGGIFSGNPDDPTSSKPVALTMSGAGTLQVGGGLSSDIAFNVGAGTMTLLSSCQGSASINVDGGSLLSKNTLSGFSGTVALTSGAIKVAANNALGTGSLQLGSTGTTPCTFFILATPGVAS